MILSYENVIVYPIKHRLNFQRSSDEETKKLRSQCNTLTYKSYCFLYSYTSNNNWSHTVSSTIFRWYFQNLLNDSTLPLIINISSQSIVQTPCKTIIIPNSHRTLSLRFPDESFIDKFIARCAINSSFYHLESLIQNSLSTYKFIVLLVDLIVLPRLRSLTCSMITVMMI